MNMADELVIDLAASTAPKVAPLTTDETNRAHEIDARAKGLPELKDRPGSGPKP